MFGDVYMKCHVFHCVCAQCMCDLCMCVVTSITGLCFVCCVMSWIHLGIVVHMECISGSVLHSNIQSLWVCTMNIPEGWGLPCSHSALQVKTLNMLQWQFNTHRVEFGTAGLDLLSGCQINTGKCTVQDSESGVLRVDLWAWKVCQSTNMMLEECSEIIICDWLWFFSCPAAE